jgi:sugar lactone lactonase YvrE
MEKNMNIKQAVLVCILGMTGMGLGNALHADTMPDASYALMGDNIFPEGMAYDPLTRSFFVGSFYKGGIQRIQAGTASEFLPAGQDGLHSAVGMALDAAKRLLWVCNSEAGASQYATPESTGKASIHVYDIDKKSLVKRIAFDEKAGHFCNDIVLDARGDAYVTDSFSSTIWKVHAAHYTLQAWATDARFGGEGFNLNGIQLTSGGKYLIVNKMNSGQLFRLAVSDQSIQEVKLSRPIEGGDGLFFASANELLVVEGFGAKNPGITKLLFSNDYTEAAVTKKIESAKFNTPTAVKVIEGEIYVVNSQFNHLFKGKEYGAAQAPFNFVRFNLASLKKQGVM